jgi:hypothetical protein
MLPRTGVRVRAWGCKTQVLPVFEGQIAENPQKFSGWQAICYAIY